LVLLIPQRQTAVPMTDCFAARLRAPHESRVMALTPVVLYFELGHLAAEIPDLATGPITPELEQWLGRASTLVESSGSLADTIQLRTAIGNLSGMLRARNAETIAEIIQRALAKAELQAPPKAQGMFIVATNAFDSFAAVRKVLRTARSDVLLVAPDADAKVLTDFAVLAPDGVIVRLLADEAEHKKSLERAARHWLRRFGGSRPLFVRVAAAGTLSDTLILVDGVVVWALRRSFNQVAKSPYASLVRIPAQEAVAMIAAYAAGWRAAEPMFQAE
jgi:hypothetical protein